MTSLSIFSISKVDIIGEAWDFIQNECTVVNHPKSNRNEVVITCSMFMLCVESAMPVPTNYIRHIDGGVEMANKNSDAKIKLGKLERFEDIRSVWDNENHFSDWLFEQERLNILSEALEISEIQPVEREANAGDFRVDIKGVLKDGSDSQIVIENKFGRSDHDHLGKALTYAAVLDARYVIWIVEKARSEHISLVEWLNNNMSEKGFFLVELELWKIGHSDVAPRFNIIEKPNVRRQAMISSDSESEIRNYEYWSQFLEYVSDRKDFMAAFPGSNRRSPSPKIWYVFSKNLPGFEVNALRYRDEVAVEVYINNNKEMYYMLEEQREEIDKELGFYPSWEPLDNRKASRIRYTKKISDIESDQHLNEWYADTILKFRLVILKHVEKMMSDRR